MQKIFYSTVFLLALLIPSVACQAAELTESTVSRMIALIDSAALRKDVNTLAQLVSDDVDISVESSDRVTHMGKAQYFDSLQKSWSQTKNTTYSRNNIRITLEGPNKASFSSDVLESFTLNGDFYSGKTAEESVVEVRNGHALVTKIVAHVTLLAPSGQ